MTFTVNLIDDEKMEIQLAEGGKIQLIEQNNARFELAESELFILTKKGQIKQIGLEAGKVGKLEFDHLLIMDASSFDLEAPQLAQYLTETAEAAGLKLSSPLESIKLPKNIYNAAAKAMDKAFAALAPFGYRLEKKKFVSTKAQHRWKKALSTLEFHIEHEGTSGEILWEKATQMRLKAGAKILPETEIPLRADGTPGFTAKFALNLRNENRDKIDEKTWTTTEDILLRSVNEIGHFVYFAGTNSWLEIFDAEGHSIHELSVVK